jgi:hypothetical protein
VQLLERSGAVEQMAPVTLTHTSDIDMCGLLHWIGTNGHKQ